MINNSGEGTMFQKCPYPDCETPYMEWVTNAHCVKEHGMSKKELIEKHGEIEEVKMKKRRKYEIKPKKE